MYPVKNPEKDRLGLVSWVLFVRFLVAKLKNELIYSTTAHFPRLCGKPLGENQVIRDLGIFRQDTDINGPSCGLAENTEFMEEGHRHHPRALHASCYETPRM